MIEGTKVVDGSSMSLSGFIVCCIALDGDELCERMIVPIVERLCVGTAEDTTLGVGGQSDIGASEYSGVGNADG